MAAGTRILLNSRCRTPKVSHQRSVLLYGLGRAAHGSWGQIGVHVDALRVLYIKWVFFHT